MKLEFHKYQGTGNDFVLIDNRKHQLRLSKKQIETLTDRRFGIGADGLILIENHAELDFEMIYYNSDGSRSFCGNGARCAVRFSSFLGICKKEARFLAVDGEHQAKITKSAISIQMSPVDTVEMDGSAFVVDTGSPHFIEFVKDINTSDIVEKGRAVRYSDKYKKDGINVNLVQEDTLEMRTYERGVEAETLSCGTGATAVALAYAEKHDLNGLVALDIKVRGGFLQVAFNREESFKDIFLKGPAEKVFSGVYDL
ncbi:MAG: diaminopimelate epimerase [Lishizhenia sp.]